MGFPGGASSKEPTCQCRKGKKLGFDPWVRKIPWKRKQQLTPVFLSGESHGQRSLVGCRKLDMTEATKCARTCLCACTHTHTHTHTHA